ncbi:MAG: thiamine phosphate synthase [Candidatus Xiphinematobacter sp.]|nr:MAG: thiamine phosphate synthase [Candidatus Xiphinematobacter sp.]
MTRTGVSGFHIGQEDLSLDKARALAGRDVIGGCSTHNITQAQSASSAGADYISFGPLFHASTKPGYPPTGLAHIKEVKEVEVHEVEVHNLVVHDLVSVPIFCIGGIKRENLPTILSWMQAPGVSLSSPAFFRPTNIRQFCRDCKALLGEGLQTHAVVLVLL